MSFYDIDVKPKSSPKEYGIRMAEMRKKNRNRCAKSLRKAYRKEVKK